MLPMVNKTNTTYQSVSSSSPTRLNRIEIGYCLHIRLPRKSTWFNFYKIDFHEQDDHFIDDDDDDEDQSLSSLSGYDSEDFDELEVFRFDGCKDDNYIVGATTTLCQDLSRVNVVNQS